MEEKRTRQRRSYKAAGQFPFTDSNGCVVPFDRSRRADRRLNNLLLKENDELGIKLNECPDCDSGQEQCCKSTL